MNDDVAVFYMRNHRDIHIVDINAFKKAISFKVNNVRLELCALIEPNGKAPKMNDQVVASPLLQFFETGAIPMNPSTEETCQNKLEGYKILALDWKRDRELIFIDLFTLTMHRAKNLEVLGWLESVVNLPQTNGALLIFQNEIIHLDLWINSQVKFYYFF